MEKERDEALFLIDHMEDHADEGFNRIQQQSVKVATEVREGSRREKERKRDWRKGRGIFGKDETNWFRF